MNQLTTQGIVLQRTDYGEADRIITVLTPESGKLHLMAKGVRRVRSKLAGGIELFSESELTYAPGKASLGTLLSARLIIHFATIVQDIDRTMRGYDFIRFIHKTTEDEAGNEYYLLLRQGLQLLDMPSVSIDFATAWFSAQLLRLTGHLPNLRTDKTGAKLSLGEVYQFDFESVCFGVARDGQDGALDTGSIKYLRLLFGDTVSPRSLAAMEEGNQYTIRVLPLITTLRQYYLSV